MLLATADLDAAFFDAIDFLVDLDDEREMRGRDVPLDMPIFSHEIYEEI